MKHKITMVALLLALAAAPGAPRPALAGDCMACHQKHGITPRTPLASPIAIMVDGNKQEITLEDAFTFHGHQCPGATTAFRAVQYGINLLFPEGAPARDDLLVISRTPAAGVKDLIDLVMKGDNPARKTWPPIGMEKAQGNFTFTVIRKSTCEAVDVRLKEGVWPADYFLLKKKEKAGTMNDGEWNRLHGYMKEIIVGFPVRPPEELFGRPTPYKLIIWGALQPGEQDTNIRKMRQEQKKKLLGDGK